MLLEDLETDVLETVREFTDAVEFYSGTLFVECGENLARHIWHVLVDRYGIEHIRVSPVGKQYAFDFV